MALIAFTKNHQDLSTDKGYQFNFYCDKCGNGYMTSFQTSVVGTAGAFLRAAGDIFGGSLSGAGYGAYEVQRAIGGPQHDKAFAAAVEECKAHFCQCRGCGLWVCPEVCWNGQAGQCKACAPDFQQEMVSAHAHAKADAMRQQMNDAANKQNYVGGIDMSGDAVHQAPHPQFVPAPPPPGYHGPLPGQGAADPYRDAGQGPSAGGYGAPPQGYPQGVPQGFAPTAAQTALPCAKCQKTTGGLKFCEECGTPRALVCPNCNQALHAGAKFCGTCGTHI